MKYKQAVINAIKTSSKEKPVDTVEAVRTRMLDALGDTYSSSKYYVSVGTVESPQAAELSDLMIGGYGDTNGFYGAGPTRNLPNATYFMRTAAIAKGVPLYKGFLGLGKSTPELDALVALRDGVSKVDPARYADLLKRPVTKPQNPVSVASGPVDYDGTNRIHCELLVSNVTKNKGTYYGDVSVILAKDMGSGINYMKREEYQEPANDADWKTQSVLSGKSNIGQRLRDQSVNIKRNLENTAKNYFGAIGGKNVETTSMITVDNI